MQYGIESKKSVLRVSSRFAFRLIIFCVILKAHENTKKTPTQDENNQKSIGPNELVICNRS